MRYIQTHDQSGCPKVLAERIASELSQGKKVLWLLSGGSNIAISVPAMVLIRKTVSTSALSHLAVILTDERYGPIGHKDSNWFQLLQAGFDFTDIEAVPTLVGSTLKQTVRVFGKEIERLSDWADIVIGQFGIGADGHTAGVLPHTIGVTSADTTVDYESGPFTRITMTLQAIRKIDAAYIFAFGESKKKALEELKNSELPLDNQPAQILKQISEAFLYTDQ